MQTPTLRLYIWRKNQTTMKNNKTAVNNLKALEKEEKVTNDGLYSSLGITGNIAEKATLAVLADSHNSLARNVGIPCELEITAITPYPAVTEEYGVHCKGFGGYRVPLEPLSKGFYKVRFRGKGNGKKVVCGYIVNSQGYVESVATVCDGDGFATLPLTPDSHALYASVPTRRGKPVWGRITVELMPHGLRQAVECYMYNIIMCVKEIARDVERLKRNNNRRTKRILN